MNKQVQDNPGRVQGGQAFMARVFSRRCNASAVRQDREFQVMKTSGMGRGFRCLWAGLRGRAGLLMLAALVGLMQATSAWAQSAGCAAVNADWNSRAIPTNFVTNSYPATDFLTTDEIRLSLSGSSVTGSEDFEFRIGYPGGDYAAYFFGWGPGSAATVITGTQIRASATLEIGAQRGHVGETLNITVTCTSAGPVNNPPLNTVMPSISGTATVGNVLLSSTGTWTDADGDPLSYSYQWYRADDNSGLCRDPCGTDLIMPPPAPTMDCAASA